MKDGLVSKKGSLMILFVSNNLIITSYRVKISKYSLLKEKGESSRSQWKTSTIFVLLEIVSKFKVLLFSKVAKQITHLNTVC